MTYNFSFWTGKIWGRNICYLFHDPILIFTYSDWKNVPTSESGKSLLRPMLEPCIIFINTWVCVCVFGCTNARTLQREVFWMCITHEYICDIYTILCRSNTKTSQFLLTLFRSDIFRIMTQIDPENIKTKIFLKC